MLLFATIALVLAPISCYIVNPGPLVIATKGEVWPKPQEQTKSNDYYILNPSLFSFNTVKTDKVACQALLSAAYQRYWSIISDIEDAHNSNYLTSSKKFQNTSSPYLNVLDVKIKGECPGDEIQPNFNMVENYTLTVESPTSTLEAPTYWGVLRGLETFSQLVYFHQETAQLVINATSIVDFPRFPHRGLLVDTSRHFIPKHVLLDIISAMSFNKFNVFHWHITDDQSFPYQSRTFPELSDKGAYHPETLVYNSFDVKEVIEYARVRGIRVIPEIDTPGHTRSWGVSHPELLTQCYKHNKPDGDLGPMDPSKETTYTFLKKLFAEIVTVFPDEYFHIGGDEVDFDCWQSNEKIGNFMKANNIQTYEELEGYFIQKVVTMLNNLKSKYLVWEEVFVNGVDIPNSTVVHVWRNDGFRTLKKVTAAGKYALYSSDWYLDHLATGGDWMEFYGVEPTDFGGTPDEVRLLVGGEACMWGESVNEYNIMARIWPRASATAEKLWSAQDTKDVEDAKKRLEEHACRMNKRGIPAQPPNGPGVCL